MRRRPGVGAAAREEAPRERRGECSIYFLDLFLEAAGLGEGCLGFTGWAFFLSLDSPTWACRN